MPDRETRNEGQKETEKRQSVGEVHLKPAGEAHVKPQDTPVEPPADKRIHSRRPLPLVPEGPDDADDEERDR